MTSENYWRVVGLIWAIVVVLQFIRALIGWPVTVGTTISIPVWISWIACIVAAILAWLSFELSRRA